MTTPSDARPSPAWRWCRCWCWASSSCCRSAACSPGLLSPTATFDPGGGARGARPGRESTGSLWFTRLVGLGGDRWSRAAGPAGRVRPAPAGVPGPRRWSGRCCWCRSCCRPSWWASRSGSCSGESGPLGFLGLDGTAGRDHRRPGLLQRRGRDPGGRRRLGVAGPAARRGGGGARREPGPGVPHRDPARRCGRRSCRRRAWCSCSARRRSGSC